MSPAALALALLSALSLHAQVRTAAPRLTPTLSAPLAPAPLTLTLTPPTAAALPLPVAAAPAVKAAAPAPARPAAREALTQTVAAMAKGGEAAQAPALAHLFVGERPKAVNAAAVLGSEGAGRAPLRLLPAAPAPSRPAPAPARRLDLDGSKMKAALRELAGRSAPEPLAVDFEPAPESLKAMAELDYEVFLFRDRADGRWRMAKGDRWGVSGDFGDYDRGFHNHPDMRLGVHSLYSPLPSPADLVNAAGKDARVFVVSKQGVAEWNTTTPFLDEPGRFLKAQDPEADKWLARLEGGSWARRLVMRLAFPSGWGTLAKSLGLAMELRPWKKVTQEWLDAGKAPETAATLEARLAPALAEEALKTAGRMAGRTLSKEEVSDVVRRTRLVAVGLSKLLFNEFGVMASYPDGVARPDRSIELTFKRPETLPDAEAYYRALFAHEYTHRLQFEGDVTRRYGIEAPPVAVELLRGIELVGLEGLEAGRIPFITPNTLSGFAAGRAWAEGPRTGDAGFHFKGAIAGAAYELSRATGRPEDAWEFARRVSSERRPEAPAAVYADILAR